MNSSFLIDHVARALRHVAETCRANRRFAPRRSQGKRMSLATSIEQFAHALVVDILAVLENEHEVADIFCHLGGFFLDFGKELPLHRAVRGIRGFRQPTERRQPSCLPCRPWRLAQLVRTLVNFHEHFLGHGFELRQGASALLRALSGRQAGQQIGSLVGIEVAHDQGQGLRMLVPQNLRQRRGLICSGSRKGAGPVSRARASMTWYFAVSGSGCGPEAPLGPLSVPPEIMSTPSTRIRENRGALHSMDSWGWPQIHDSFGNVGYFLAIHALEDISRKFVTYCQ